MTGLIGDLRYGVRGLLRNRSLAAVAILSLALGIGANTTIFAVLNAVFLRSMPVYEPASLAAVKTLDSTTPGDFDISYPTYRDLRDQSSVFRSLVLYLRTTASMSGNGDPRLVMVHLVSDNYFQTLGIPMARGRALERGDEGSPGSAVTAVITYSLWMRAYSGDPQVTSRTVELNGKAYQIVGVAPEAFQGLNQLAGADVFLPFSAYPQVFPAPGIVDSRRALLCAAVGRLRQGWSLAQANAALQPVSQELERQYPENRGRRLRLISLEDAAVTDRPRLSRAGAILMAISGVVLLIACGNVASLLLARATARNREIAIRLAMGAGRGRLVRQLLTESLVLALVGGAAGLLVARWARDLLWSLRPPTFVHAAFSLNLDSRVFLFAFVTSVVTAIVFGLVPALRATAPDLAGDLKERGSASGGLNRVWTARSVLVIVQVALSLVALVGAGLFLRSLQNATGVDTGFDSAHLATVSYNLTEQGYGEVRGRQFHESAVERALSVPGVASAALSRDLPFRVAFIRGVVLSGQEPRGTLTSVVSPGYFQTMRIPLLRGRDFTPTDTKTAPRIVIVNQAAASIFWPGEDPIGKVLNFAGDKAPFEVVGVARNANYLDIGEPAKPLVYLSLVQFPLPTAVLYLRTAGDPSAVLGSVKRELQALDPKLLLQAETMRVSMREMLWVQRLSAGLLGIFGALALVLSTVGIYGVISYSVRQRTREIGVRLALGASRGDVERLILREGIRLVAIGVLIGSVMSLSASGFVGELLLLRTTRDVMTFTLVPSILTLVGLLACWAPARRATRIEPSRALRDE